MTRSLTHEIVKSVSESLEAKNHDIDEKVTAAIAVGLLEIAKSAADPQYWRVASLLRGTESGSAKAINGEPGIAERVIQTHAYLMHVRLQDDSYKTAFHPGQLVIPTALALAQATGADGRIFRRAVHLSYEVACRLADAFLPEASVRGWRITALLAPAVSAAAAISILAPGDNEKLIRAIELAGTVMGSPIHTTRGGNQWQLQPALQAHVGLAIARLVQGQGDGDGGGLESQLGPLEHFTGSTDYKNQEEGHRLLELAFKPYAAPMFAQALLRACDEIEVPAGFTISRVNAFISPFAHQYGGSDRASDSVANLEGLLRTRFSGTGSRIDFSLMPDSKISDYEARLAIFDDKGRELTHHCKIDLRDSNLEWIVRGYSEIPKQVIENLIQVIADLESAIPLAKLEGSWNDVYREYERSRGGRL